MGGGEKRLAGLSVTPKWGVGGGLKAEEEGGTSDASRGERGRPYGFAPTLSLRY